MVDSTNPRIMADNIKMLAAGGGSGGTTVVANPEGETTAKIEKLGIDDVIYEIPKDPGYSTSEVLLVGNDVDGKARYRKVFVSDSAMEQGANAITIGVENISNIININALIYNTSGLCSKLPLADDEATVDASSSTITITLSQNYALYRANAGYRVYIEYTKTPET